MHCLRSNSFVPSRPARTPIKRPATRAARKAASATMPRHCLDPLIISGVEVRRRRTAVEVPCVRRRRPHERFLINCNLDTPILSLPMEQGHQTPPVGKQSGRQAGTVTAANDLIHIVLVCVCIIHTGCRSRRRRTLQRSMEHQQPGHRAELDVTHSARLSRATMTHSPSIYGYSVHH